MTQVGDFMLSVRTLYEAHNKNRKYTYVVIVVNSLLIIPVLVLNFALLITGGGVEAVDLKAPN